VKTFVHLLALVLLPATLAAGPRDIVERDTIRKTVQIPSSADGHRLEVDIVNGSMRVTGYDGNEVQVVAYKTIRAESASRMERARTEVTLDIRSGDDGVIVFEETPDRRYDEDRRYRDDDGDRGYRRNRRGSRHGWDSDGYDVEFELEIRVPSNVDFYLSTVNGEDIDVENLHGKFGVSNINGGIDMRSVSGSGSIGTINGDVRVAFTKNPSEHTSFKTLNGEIDVRFPSTPSADMRFKTMNGEVYTDFEVKGMSMPASVREKRGKKVYGSGDAFRVQSGGGGPELTFDSLNGNIYLSLKGENR